MKTLFFLLSLAFGLMACEDQLQETTINFKVESSEGYPVLRAEISLNDRFEGFTNIQGYLQVKIKAKADDRIKVYARKKSNNQLYSDYEKQVAIKAGEENNLDLTLYTVPKHLKSENKPREKAKLQNKSSHTNDDLGEKKFSQQVDDLRPKEKAELYEPTFEKAQSYKLHVYNPGKVQTSLYRKTQDSNIALLCKLKNGGQCAVEAQDPVVALILIPENGALSYHKIDLRKQKRLVFHPTHRPRMLVHASSINFDEKKALAGAKVRVNGLDKGETDQFGLLQIDVKSSIGDYASLSIDPGDRFYKKDRMDFVLTENNQVEQTFTTKNNRIRLWLDPTLDIPSQSLSLGRQDIIFSSKAENSDFVLSRRSSFQDQKHEFVLKNTSGQIIYAKPAGSGNLNTALEAVMRAIPSQAVIKEISGSTVYFAAAPSASSGKWLAFGTSTEENDKNRFSKAVASVEPLRLTTSGLMMGRVRQLLPRSHLQKGDQLIASNRLRRLKLAHSIAFVDRHGRALQNVSLYDGQNFLGASDEKGMFRSMKPDLDRLRLFIPDYKLVRRQKINSKALKMTLGRKFIRVKISSRPSGAKVFADNKLIGLTPLDQKVAVQDKLMKFQIDSDEPYHSKRWQASTSKALLSWEGKDALVLNVDHYKTAENARKEARYETAIEHYQKIEETSDSSILAKKALGEIYYAKLQDYEQSAKFLRQVCSQNKHPELSLEDYQTACRYQSSALTKLAEELGDANKKRKLIYLEASIAYRNRIGRNELSTQDYLDQGESWQKVFLLTGNSVSRDKAMEAFSVAAGAMGQQDQVFAKKAQFYFDSLAKRDTAKRATL